MKRGVAARRLAEIGLAIVLIASAGCEMPAESSSPPRSSDTPAASASSATQSDYTGVWTVVAHHMPGISALSEDEANALHGEIVRLTANEALSSGDRCDAPTYAVSTVPAEEYLAIEFKVPPSGLKPLASRLEITLTEVLCAGKPWPAFGGTLLGIDANRALAPWDGVFFELARDRDFRALGQEPGWQLEIRKGVAMRFVYDYGEGEATTPAPTPQTNLESGVQTYHAVTETQELHVVIEPKACSDTMSGKPFAATVTVTLDERTFHGCGEPMVEP